MNNEDGGGRKGRTTSLHAALAPRRTQLVQSNANTPHTHGLGETEDSLPHQETTTSLFSKAEKRAGGDTSQIIYLQVYESLQNVLHLVKLHIYRVCYTTLPPPVAPELVEGYWQG